MIFGRRCGETRRLKSAIENEGLQDALRGAAIIVPAARQKNVRQKNKDPIFLSYIFPSVRSGVAETMIETAYFKALRTKVMAPALKIELRYPSQNFLTDLNESWRR